MEKELTFEEIKGVIDQLREMKVFSINFGGGEPLLRKDFVDIVKYASDLNFGIILSTNGYLVNDDFLDKLEDLKTFTVQVSVDGLEKTHDKFRGVKGSFNKAVNALKLFAERGYNATMSTMILRDNIDEMKDLCNLAVELGISSMKLSSFMPAGRGDESATKHMLTKEELKDFASHIHQLQEEYKERLYIDDKPTYPFLLSDNGSPSKVTGRKVRIGCSAGRTNLVISPNGMVYACPFLTDMPAGDLRKERLKDIWRGSEILSVFRNMDSSQLKGKCSTCKHIPINCQGGCRAAAWLATGDFYGEDPFCWYGCGN
jgi:radical SAM protein with 4Fe4S-binding SPASM domain